MVLMYPYTNHNRKWLIFMYDLYEYICTYICICHVSENNICLYSCIIV